MIVAMFLKQLPIQILVADSVVNSSLQLINALYYHRIFSIVLKGPQRLGARGVEPGEGVVSGDL